MIPSSLIKEYLEAKFTENRVFGQEFTTNSVFEEDDQLKMSINMVTGLWQDFKSHERGNFPQLIAAVEEISYPQAVSYLRSKMFDTPEHLFDVSTLNVEVQKSTSSDSLAKIFSGFKKFNPEKIDPTSLTQRLARKFVLSRKLQNFEFYIADSGRYANRIIIPYQFPGSDTPFYFQARNLSMKGIKYLNPSREVTGLKSSDILFPFNEDCDYVFLTEGPTCAIAMQVNGVNATCTQGSNLSQAQAEMLKGKQIIFAYDSDKAGVEGVVRARKVLLGKNRNDFALAGLPEGFKDWGELHIACSSKAQYVSVLRDGLKLADFGSDITEALG